MEQYAVKAGYHGSVGVGRVVKETAKTVMVNEQWDGKFADMVSRWPASKIIARFASMEEANAAISKARAVWREYEKYVQSSRQKLAEDKTTQRTEWLLALASHPEPGE